MAEAEAEDNCFPNTTIISLSLSSDFHFHMNSQF